MANQDDILDKLLDYFNNQISMVKNQGNMMKAFTKLTQVMNMAFSQVANNNDNIQVTILAFEIGNDENENDALL